MQAGPLPGSVRLVGSQNLATAVAGLGSTPGEPVLYKNIFTTDEKVAMEQGDAWVDEDTVQELDEDVKDPQRVYNRIGKVRKAIQRREKRLQRAHAAVQA